MKDLSQLPKLFFTFFKIGAFTFGGGYAMVSLIQRETVETHHWVTDDDILDMLAIAESTPGVIAINSATFVGYRVAGFWGALCATLGVSLPSFLIISILSQFITQYQQIKWIAWLFEGIRAGVVVLIVGAVVKFWKKCPKNLFTVLLLMLAFVGAAFFDISVILLLVLAGAAGVVRALVLRRKSGGEAGV